MSTKTVGFSVTEAEAKAIKDAAHAANMGVSPWIESLVEDALLDDSSGDARRAAILARIEREARMPDRTTKMSAVLDAMTAEAIKVTGSMHAFVRAAALEGVGPARDSAGEKLARDVETVIDDIYAAWMRAEGALPWMWQAERVRGRLEAFADQALGFDLPTLTRQAQDRVHILMGWTGLTFEAVVRGALGRVRMARLR